MTATLQESPSGSMIAEAIRIRAFEFKLLELFKRGLISGPVHTCIGQEFCAAALHPPLRKGVDAFFASPPGHGHYLAHGGPGGGGGGPGGAGGRARRGRGKGRVRAPLPPGGRDGATARTQQGG